MKLRVAMLAAVALLAAACGDDGAPTTTAGEPGTTTTGEAAQTTTTTTPVSTSTTTPVPATTSVPVVPAADGYVVAGVAADDVLNVRSGPGVDNPVIATLEPDATGVITTGLATEDLVTDGWWEVETDAGVGWVNSTFLSLPPQWSVPFADVPCFSAEGGFPQGSGRDANHVLALEHLSSAECERIVILLGRDALGGVVDWPLFPAASLPVVPIKAFSDLHSVTVSLPPPIPMVRPTATEMDFGTGRAFLVRRPDDGGFDVKLHFSDDVKAGIFVLEGPARIVVDVALTPNETGDDLLGAAGPRVALATALDPLGEGLRPPITIRGYARPFEAQGVVQLLEATGTPGTGDPVEATWTGGLGPSTGTDYGFMTTDWISAWGLFEITLVDAPAGAYELFVGEFSAEDGTPVGLYEPLTILD